MNDVNFENYNNSAYYINYKNDCANVKFVYYAINNKNSNLCDTNYVDVNFVNSLRLKKIYKVCKQIFYFNNKLHRHVRANYFVLVIEKS